jgi:hypothetical protein
VFNRRDVALMIRVAIFFKPDFGRKDHWNDAHIRMMASGRRKPSQSMLDRFNLQEQGGQYTWIP